MSEATISFPILGESFSMSPPTYFTLFGWHIHWYGVIIAVGFVLAVLYAVKRSRQFGLSEDDIIDMLILAVPLAVICARLYYVVFYRDAGGENPYFDGLHDLKDIISVWEGGLAIYGGVIGGVLGVLISMSRRRHKTKAMMDLGSLGMLIGQAVGRWGNFINREAYGAETTAPWRMGLSNQWGTWYYHPTFLYESLWNLLGLLLLHLYSKKRKFDGQIFLMYLGWYGLGRTFIEGLRTDSLYLAGTGLRVSQLVGLVTFAAAAVILLYVFLFRRPDPDDMLANRGKAAGETPAGKPPEDDGDKSAEELNAAYRSLTGEENIERTERSGEGEENG